MTARHCPHCGHTLWTYQAPMERILADVGDEWAVVVPDASRNYFYKLRKRFPAFEWRHQPIVVTGDLSGDRWRVEARRR